MWKAPASVFCGCLAALPLIGCAGSGATSGQVTQVTPARSTEPAAYYAPAPRVYAVGPAAPAAVLVLWPGDDNLASDPGLWTAQGFDVVMPQSADVYRLVADQQAELAGLISSAQALADAPIWIVGPGPVVDAALAGPRRSGIGAADCHEPDDRRNQRVPLARSDRNQCAGRSSRCKDRQSRPSRRADCWFMDGGGPRGQLSFRDRLGRSITRCRAAGQRWVHARSGDQRAVNNPNLDWRSAGGRGALRRGRSIPVGSGSSPLFCRCHYDVLRRHECRDHGSGRRGASANASRCRHD